MNQLTKKPWLGWQGLEVLGAEGQLGVPHPHALLTVLTLKLPTL